MLVGLRTKQTASRMFDFPELLRPGMEFKEGSVLLFKFWQGKTSSLKLERLNV